jgi:hypothetical protein
MLNLFLADRTSWRILNPNEFTANVVPFGEQLMCDIARSYESFAVIIVQDRISTSCRGSAVKQ